MNKRNGFTLVELLAVIVILAIVLIIAVPGVLSIINKTKNSAYDRQLDMIKEATRTYVTTSPNIDWRNNQTVVNLSDLQGQGILDQKVFDPKTKKEIKGLAVIVTKKDNRMNYEIVYTDESNANYPVYSKNMIPIVYKDNTWVKANSTNEKNDWFDYTKQQWANVATVSEDVRDTLIKASPGTEVPMDKINAMFTWIPRFKYKLFNVDGTVSPVGNPNMAGDYKIEVKMEGIGTSKSTGNQNGQWLTHPAFTFGTEELSGFWVAKFETGNNAVDDAKSIPTNLYQPENLVIKPNATVWMRQTLSTMLKSIGQMGATGNQFGLSKIEDPHLMKNIEWGAMTYLTNSQYGKQGNDTYSGVEKEVRVNNQFKTGCGATTNNAASDGTCNSYETKPGQAASTTGNVTGIYDTNGAGWDVVASSMTGADGVNQIVAGSGLSQETLNQLVREGKYFDAYDFSTSTLNYTKGHLGDATIEMGPFSAGSTAWYNDMANFLTNNYPGVSSETAQKPFFARGGAVWSDGSIDGITAFFPWASNTPDDKNSRITLR